MPERQALPAVAYQVVSDTPVHASGADAPNRAARIQINSYGDKQEGAAGYGSAKAVAVQVHAALSRYSGTVGSDAVIENIFQELEFDDYEPSTETARVVQDYTVYYHPV
jgi:hypothetical protein